ncbi:hypothetical protein ACOSQ4_006446 [Xanthoceras sorbifolium]
MTLAEAKERIGRLEKIVEEPPSENIPKIAVMCVAHGNRILTLQRTVADIWKDVEVRHFKGSRNAKELENFLWDMEQYFRAAKIPEREQVCITSMYLSGDTKLWWRTRLADDLGAGRLRIET